MTYEYNAPEDPECKRGRGAPALYYFTETQDGDTYKCYSTAAANGPAAFAEVHLHSVVRGSADGYWYAYRDHVWTGVNFPPWSRCGGSACRIETFGEEARFKCGRWSAKFAGSGNHPWQWWDGDSWNTVQNQPPLHAGQYWSTGISGPFPTGIWSFSYFKGCPTAITHHETTAIADTYVDQTADSVNFGSSPELRVNSGIALGSRLGNPWPVIPIRTTLLKFDTEVVSGTPITNAKLRLCARNSAAAGGDLSVIADNSWDENTVTWQTAPRGETYVASVGAVVGGNCYEIDGSDIVWIEGVYSFQISSSVPTEVDYASKETPDLAPTLIFDADY